MKKKKIAGMSLAVVVMFVLMMTVLGLAMIVSSTTAFRSAQILPEADGTYFSAEAAMNRNMPIIAQALTSSTNPAAGPAATTIRDAARAVAEIPDTRTALIAAWDPALPDNQQGPRNEAMRAELEKDPGFIAALNAGIQALVTGTPDFYLPEREPFSASIPTTAGTAGSDAGSNHFFFAYSATDLDTAVYGFHAPAFVNLARVAGSGAVDVGFTVNVKGPQNGPYEIFVIPYITIVSEAGDVGITEDVTLPISSFMLQQDDGPPWNSNTIFNQGLGPGGYTFTTFAGSGGGYPDSPVGLLIWLNGAGAGQPPEAIYPSLGEYPSQRGPRGRHRRHNNNINYAFHYAVHANPATTSPRSWALELIPEPQVPVPGCSDCPNCDCVLGLVMYASDIPADLVTFVKNVFPEPGFTFHPTFPVPGATRVMVNPFSSGSPHYTAMQELVDFGNSSAGLAELPHNGHFGGMSTFDRGGMRCPYRHAVYFLLRLGNAMFVADNAVKPPDNTPGGAFSTASENPPNATAVYIPGSPGSWVQRTDSNQNLDVFLSGHPNARYLRIVNGANSAQYLRGTINMPQLAAVHANDVRIRFDATFNGRPGGNPTRFYVSGGIEITEPPQPNPPPIDVTIMNVRFIANAQVGLNLRADGSFSGNAIFSSAQTITIAGTNITVGAPNLAPQFFSDQHVSLTGQGAYHGVFASTTDQIINPPPAGSTLVGMVLANYRPSNSLNQWLPGDETLTATMLPNAFELIRSVVMSQATGGSGVGTGEWVAPEPPPGGGAVGIGTPGILGAQP